MKRILISGVIGCSVLAFCSFTNGTSASAQHRDGYTVQDESSFQDTTMKKKKHKKKDSTSVTMNTVSPSSLTFQDTTKKKKKDTTTVNLMAMNTRK